MRGRFISFEGGEGVGKSTQTRLLAEALEARGIEVVTTREPGGTQGAEAIRELLLYPPGEGWKTEAEALLFAAARSDHALRLIEPSLAAGKWVVCDRFVDSSRAYQGGAGALGDAEILTLHRVGSGGLMPDLTFLLEADEEATAARLARRGEDSSDAIESRNAAYHCQVANAFTLLAMADPERIIRVASSGSIEGTHASIMQALEPLLASMS
jgi:dTMP kinase